jgi:hypothetical protein
MRRDTGPGADRPHGHTRRGETSPMPPCRARPTASGRTPQLAAWTVAGPAKTSTVSSQSSFPTPPPPAAYPPVAKGGFGGVVRRLARARASCRAGARATRPREPDPVSDLFFLPSLTPSGIAVRDRREKKSAPKPHKVLFFACFLMLSLTPSGILHKAPIYIHMEHIVLFLSFSLSLLSLYT